MNHFQLQSSLGSFVFSWTSQGLLNRIRWFHKPIRVAELGGDEVLDLDRAPAYLGRLIERFGKTLATGAPMAEVPWEHIDQSGWTPFQKQVFEATYRIPHGETRTYAWLALRIGQPQAARAAGQALKVNPLPVLIPCHRVIHSKGTLGGFFGKSDENDPEIHLKEALLQMEERYLNPLFPFLQAHLQHSLSPTTGSAPVVSGTVQ